MLCQTPSLSKRCVEMRCNTAFRRPEHRGDAQLFSSSIDSDELTWKGQENLKDLSSSTRCIILPHISAEGAADTDIPLISPFGFT